MTAASKTPPGFAWPHGARIAVATTCLMENWSGDKGPPFSVQTTGLKPGTHDRAAMTWGTYGSRNGVWRLLKILNDIRCRQPSSPMPIPWKSRRTRSAAC